MAIFNIGKDFSDHPIGRFYSDGNSSGEEFREEYLLPRVLKLADSEKLAIIIDEEVDGYGSSFLVEGFAGIVKYGYMTGDELLAKIEIHFSDDDFKFFKDKIESYIKNAKFDSKTYQSTKGT